MKQWLWTDFILSHGLNESKFYIFLVFQASSVAQDARTPPEQQAVITDDKETSPPPAASPTTADALPAPNDPGNSTEPQSAPKLGRFQRVDFSTEKYPIYHNNNGTKAKQASPVPASAPRATPAAGIRPENTGKTQSSGFRQRFPQKTESTSNNAVNSPDKMVAAALPSQSPPSVVTVDNDSDDIIMLPAVESPVTRTPGNSLFLRTQRNGTPNGNQSINQPMHSMVDLTPSSPTKPDLTKAARVSPGREQTLPVKSKSRFNRSENPVLPEITPKVAPPLNLGRHTELFRTAMPKNVKFIDSHTHFDFTLGKLEQGPIKTYAAMREKFPELYPESYGGAVQVFCSPQSLKAPLPWGPRLMDGTEREIWFSYGLHPNWASEVRELGIWQKDGAAFYHQSLNQSAMIHCSGYKISVLSVDYLNLLSV